MAEEKTIAIFNRGQRTYHVHSGKNIKNAQGVEVPEIIDLAPGVTLKLPERVAKDLLGYPDLVDFTKYIPADKETENLREENAKLKDRVTQLEAELEKKAPKDKKGVGPDLG